MMTINGIQVNPDKLLSKEELLNFLRENGESDRALAHIRERYNDAFGNDLMWRYPISDGNHLGTFIVPVREGFISLPFDIVDKDDYELLELDDATVFNDEALQYFIDDWTLFSDDLLSAMKDILRVTRGE
jgi:hypothetical protein